jgi:DNA-binding NtrC family response regulator
VTVLLLEDDVQVRNSIVAMLDFLGYSSCARGDAAGVADLISVAAPVLLMVDVSLGQSDGLTAANQVLAKHPHLPVVLISGASQAQSVKQLQTSGECVFLGKPFGADDLQSVLEHLLAAQQKGAH